MMRCPSLMGDNSSVGQWKVCLTAQQGGNKAFRRVDLLDELITEKRELERRLDMNNVDKELHDSYASRKV